MCGICGYIGTESDFQDYEQVSRIIEKMADSIKHRGPDGEGYWIDMDRYIAIGHRRLSILDLSDNGKQPMFSHSERYVLSFNGEIYNFPELRRELEMKGVRFKSQCDTEVLAECIDIYGIDTALHKAIGMFGLAVYDRDENRLYLARDRFGEKSVYYGWNNGRFVFGSELKALKEAPFFVPELDTESVYLYLKYNYIKAPWSIYKEIYKLLPGEVVALDLNNNEIKKWFYYSLEDVAVQGEKNITDKSLEECVDELDDLLTDIISHQLRADVPVGLFLSSGIDSAVTSAIAQKVTNGRLKTYSIGSYDESINEAELAKEYARILGTEHHEYYLDDKECMDLILKIPGMYDEPFGQPSAIPTYLVSKLARQDVTVAISGDGGDEMFTGYKRDILSPAEWYMTTLKKEKQERYSDRYDYLQYRMFKAWMFRDEILLVNSSEERHYRQFGSDKILGILNQALHFEALTFMESETLVKVDRASMIHSLEVREPFLDPRIAEFAFQLPEKYKYDAGRTKLILKSLLSRYLPENLYDIPKRGFHIPMNRYLVSDAFKEIREWAFSEDTLEKSGLFEVSFTKNYLENLLLQQDKMPIQSVVYNILMLQLWLKENQYV